MIGQHAGCLLVDRVPVYLSNLFRLGLIWFSRDPVGEIGPYQVLEAQPEVKEALKRAGRGTTVRRSVRLTPFGEQFVRACLPEGTGEFEAVADGDRPRDRRGAAADRGPRAGRHVSPDSVIRDTGERALLPPFTQEHEELRATIRRWVETRDRGHTSTNGTRRRSSRASSMTAPPSSASSGSSTPWSWAARAATTCTTPSGPRSSPRPEPAAALARASARTPASRPRRCGGSARPTSTSDSCAPRSPARRIAALGITEPGAGSDVASIRTIARRVPGGYVVNGAKTFITNGVRADFLVCAVKTTPDGGHHGISFLLLEREMPGYEVTRKLEKMGWHASDTGELSFTDVEVPDENLLGPENGGFYLIMANFQWERLLMALGAVGAMSRLLAVTLEYARDREAFGRPIGRFQAIRHKLAEIGIKLEVSRALTYHALREFVAGEAERREAIARQEWTHPSITAGLEDVTKAKLLSQRAAVEVADECLQIHGGYGYMREYGIERAVRDLRLGPIGGGTDEVMKEILGRRLGL